MSQTRARWLLWRSRQKMRLANWLIQRAQRHLDEVAGGEYYNVRMTSSTVTVLSVGAFLFSVTLVY